MVPAEFVAAAHELADAAGAIQRRWFRQPVTIETKSDRSPVTIADREAEAVMRDLIAARFPGHGILGEEHGSEATSAEWVWCLDPIDGTRSFISGRPLFGTLISLVHAGIAVLGIIDQSILRERWLGLRGHPTTLNGVAIRCRECPTLASALLLATGPHLFAGEDRTAFDRLCALVAPPLYGGDCYAYGQVAMGLADLVVEADLDPYDFLALAPVVEGAGGIMTDWNGRPLGLESDGRVIAAGDARVHAEAMSVLNDRSSLSGS